MNENPFQVAADIFYAENQEELETALMGGPLDMLKRDYAKQLALEQIERFSPGDEVGYKSIAYIQLGVLQMGLEDDFSDSSYSVFCGIEDSFPGTPYDIIYVSMLGGCVLAYWTNKADDNSIYRAYRFMNAYMTRVLTEAMEYAGRSKQEALSLTAVWLTVFSLVWRHRISGEIRDIVSIEAGKKAARVIDGFFTEHQISVYGWMMDKIK